MNLFLFLAEAPGIAESAKATADKFGLEWPLFLSNCFSFLLVCFLLNRFAYRPVLAMLETRREKIEEGLKNAAKIKAELADAEKKKADILAQANAEATRMIEEARASAAAIAERKTQQAIADAEQIVAKAGEAAQIERARMLADLKREVGHLVIETTKQVTGKVLTPDDQRRISEETASQLAA